MLDNSRIVTTREATLPQGLEVLSIIPQRSIAIAVAHEGQRSIISALQLK